ncbi:asialoglycoprotein receptor 2-like [Mizuhopecten yessoensis]|uniref:Asialoglycoprotein receptor 2 n=1 Tax=Mizuhopecten yessoensis TaxID=6573 RepID=A0A210QUW6_MIZYE|nr:asialoglycoprotein receptor 2-like [Mizuhopecten yessoensis]OWF52530.1 Asialoglycoprotein receptor 2 [Mizuhopecten yessoensis]
MSAMTWCFVPFLVLTAVHFNVLVLADCPNGWIKHQQCYLFSHDKLSWTGAIVMCKLLGGYLAEVQTDDEKTFLDTTAHQENKNYWIGAHDSVQEGSFVWATSREPVHIEHFGRTPDNSHGNEGCIEIYANGDWNDNNCMTSFNYICERSPESEQLIG